MSLTLATVADALIEFILSLLRDPDVAAEFDTDPEHALASRGLHHASPSDVAAVAPIIIERVHVVHVVPRPVLFERDHSPVVNQIKQVTSHLQWVDDRDTIVDQSVNQNIWAEGDVTQTFDNEAIVASGDDSVAAGGDATVDKTWDDSTTIEAGDDVNMGNDTDVQVVDGSMNEQTDASTTTDDSTTVIVDDSYDQSTQDAAADDSFNQTATSTHTTDVVTTQSAAPVQPTAEQSAAQPPAEQPAPSPEPERAEEAAAEDAGTDESGASYDDSAAQYVEADVSGEGDDGYGYDDTAPADEGDSDDF